MLPLPRLTLQSLMVVVALVAVDFVIVRGAYHSTWDIGTAFVTLPMASILILAAPKAWRTGAARRFWIGFEITGWLMVAEFGYPSHHHGAIFFRPANAVYPWVTIRNFYKQYAYLMVLDFLFYTPPQLLVDWSLGRALSTSKPEVAPTSRGEAT